MGKHHMSGKLKTIFITLSSPNVYRNLFFFPESVFFKLKAAVLQDPALRVVIVAPKKDFQKYTAALGMHLGDRLVLEAAPPVTVQNFLQKLFYFFYSYLIYTGTTRTLATLGVRPDEPPAGGKRYLAPVKILIAHTFGKISWVKKRAVPWIFARLFPGVGFLALFEKYQPSLVFVGHLYGLFDTALVALARRRTIPTSGMISNWDHFDKYYLPVQVERLFAQSDQIKDLAITYQSYHPDQITVVGYPHIDFITDSRYAVSRGQLLSELGFPTNAKYILYISGSAYCPDEPDTIEKILEWADTGALGGDVRLVIRPYLGGRGADRDFDEKKYNRFEEHPRVVFYRREFWGDLERSIQFINIMRHADAVISIYSTAVLEAAALDRPLVGIGFDGYHERPFNHSIRRFTLREHFQDVLKSGAVTIAQNFEDLGQTLKEYIADPARDREARQRMVARLCYKTDGKASERLVEFLTSAV